MRGRVQHPTTIGIWEKIDAKKFSRKEIESK
jgi:hypothetical protein